MKLCLEKDLAVVAGRYPWAIAPTINMRKLVATAIATLASTDRFIMSSSVMVANRPPRFASLLCLYRIEFQRSDGWAADAATLEVSSLMFDVTAALDLRRNEGERRPSSSGISRSRG